MIRNAFYKEKTNVLAYYIIKTVLINNYQSFLAWCGDNNLSLLQFKKTVSNQLLFCKFIEKKYNTKSMLDNIHNAEIFLNKINNKRRPTEETKYLMSNMRMSICELG